MQVQTTKQITLTSHEEKLARDVVAAAKGIVTAWGGLAQLVADFVGVGTLEEIVGRYKLLLKSKAYTAADGKAQGAIRKAFAVMKKNAFPASTNSAKARKGAQHATSKATSKAAPEQKIVKKIEHVLPEWAKDMPPLLAAWCETNPVAALAALRAAYDRDLQTATRKAA